MVKKTFTTQEVVAMLGTSEDKLRYAIRIGKVAKPESLHGGAYAWNKSEIIAAKRYFNRYKGVTP